MYETHRLWSKNLNSRILWKVAACRIQDKISISVNVTGAESDYIHHICCNTRLCACCRDKLSLLHSSEACLPWAKMRPALSQSLLPLGWARLAGFSPSLGQSWVWELADWGRGQGWNLGVGEPSSSGCCPHPGRGRQRGSVWGSMSLAHRTGWIWDWMEGGDN